MSDPLGHTATGPGLSRRTALAGIVAGVAGMSGCLARGEDSGIEGEVRIDGSNTVLPHSAAIAEEFLWRNNRVRIPVRGSGTGAGFQRFCGGETDIQNASRTILDTELARCQTNEIPFLELEVALDGIGIWVHPTNDWCECLTVEELRQIWHQGSTVETWQDVRKEWPDQTIDLYGRDAASGTFDYFTRAINGEIGNIRSDYSGSADTNVIIRGVRGNRFAMGFGGVGYYYENENDLALVGVDDGNGCVLPTRETIEDISYTPLTRSLYAYVRLDRLNRRANRALLSFYFEAIDGQPASDPVVEPGETLAWTQWAARKVGFFAITDTVIEENKNTLQDAIVEYS